MNEELINETRWALDNIPPWDDIWLDIPTSVVLYLTGITPGKRLAGNRTPDKKPDKKKIDKNSKPKKRRGPRLGKNAKGFSGDWAWKPDNE